MSAASQFKASSKEEEEEEVEEGLPRTSSLLQFDRSLQI